MTNYKPTDVIRVIHEKRLQNVPSKGRNQWMFLKKFDGARVVDYFDAAKEEADRASSGNYQGGSWWERELAWNLDHGNIELVDGGVVASSVSSEEDGSSSLDEPHTTVDSGIYVVTLNNVEAISANAHDPRIADTSVKVSKENCKFGKAHSLTGRKNNYFKTFGEHNVNFFPVAAISVEHLSRAEKLVTDQLRQYRIKGPSGRVTEWMQSVDAVQVIDVALETLNDNNVLHQKLI